MFAVVAASYSCNREEEPRHPCVDERGKGHATRAMYRWMDGWIAMAASKLAYNVHVLLGIFQPVHFQL